MSSGSRAAYPCEQCVFADRGAARRRSRTEQTAATFPDDLEAGYPHVGCRRRRGPAAAAPQRRPRHRGDRRHPRGLLGRGSADAPRPASPPSSPPTTSGPAGGGRLAAPELVGDARRRPHDIGWPGQYRCRSSPSTASTTGRSAVRPDCVIGPPSFHGDHHVEMLDVAARAAGVTPTLGWSVRGDATGWVSWDDTHSAPGPRHSAPIDPDAPAIVGFTSGTTSGAKGAVVSARSMLTVPMPHRVRCRTPSTTAGTCPRRCAH